MSRGIISDTQISPNGTMPSVSLTSDFRLLIGTRIIQIILLLSVILRILFFFFLPDSSSQFGPDEGTYAALAKDVSQGRPVQEFPAYGAPLYNTSKSVTLPSALFILFGLHELDAVRLVSSIYGFLSILALAMCFITFKRLQNNNAALFQPILDKKFIFLLTIFSFLPSNFIWSVIGLRESGSQFWLICTFLIILRLCLKENFSSLRLGLFLAISLTFAYGTRPQTASVFSLVSFSLGLFLLFHKRHFVLLPAVAVGIFTGQAFTTTPEVVSIKSFKIYEEIAPTPTLSNMKPTSSRPFNDALENEVTTPVSKLETLSENQESQQFEENVTQAQLVEVQDALALSKCTENNQIVERGDKKLRCRIETKYEAVDRNAIKTVQKQILVTQDFEFRRNVNALDAQSALPQTNCQQSSRDIIVQLRCNMSILPFRLFTFLFRPMIYFDNGSIMLLTASVENLFWMLLVSMGALAIFHSVRLSSISLINSSLFLYFLIFATAAALYEGNLGTAFRHKSSILWPLILILMNHSNQGRIKKIKFKTTTQESKIQW